MTTIDNQLQLTRAARLESLTDIHAFMGRASRQANLSGEVAFALRLSVDEICTNIMTHGYNGKEPGWIQIIFQWNAQQVQVVIRDNGHSFAFHKTAQPQLHDSWDKRRVGGLGIFLVKKMMDEIAYHSDPLTGNSVTMTKWLNSS